MGCLGILLAALFTTQVHAAAFSSASMSDFKVTLFDLNPTDEITPAMTFNLGGKNSAYVQAQDERDSQRSSVSGAKPFDLKVRSRSAQPELWSQGRGRSTSRPLVAPGAALGVPTTWGFSFYNVDAFSLTSSTGSTLTANTIVSFSALARVKATTTLGSDNFGVDDAFATANRGAFGFGPMGGTGSGNQTSFDNITSRFGSTPLMVGSFVNLTRSEVNGLLNQAVDVQGFSSVQGIPELEIHAMMLAGLSLLAAAVVLTCFRPNSGA